MKLQHCVSAALLAVLTSASAMAAPMIQFANDTGSSVTLQIVTDAVGSVGAELAVEVQTSPGLMLTGATPNLTDFFPNPGDNPFIPGSPIGGDTTGLFVDTNAGQVFAAYGSTAILQVGTFDFLTLDYTGSGSLDATGVVAQLGVLGDVLFATADVGIPEPTTGFLALIGLAGVAVRRRVA